MSLLCISERTPRRCARRESSRISLRERLWDRFVRRLQSTSCPSLQHQHQEIPTTPCRTPFSRPLSTNSPPLSPPQLPDSPCERMETPRLFSVDDEPSCAGLTQYSPFCHDEVSYNNRDATIKTCRRRLFDDGADGGNGSDESQEASFRLGLFDNRADGGNGSEEAQGATCQLGYNVDGEDWFAFLDEVAFK